ncbi:zinc finger protein 420-like, partial [Sitodiplosis mosellana]|uniref:zinc finger protein 420-like n=1 Tax=Sitodiplosis mosellana TaxID=263140 RepID=UPI002444838A
LALVMDMDPGEGTSDGRVQRKSDSVEVEIKQEPDIKDEPSNGIEFDLMTRTNGRFEADAATATSNIESKRESESDFIIDFDLNDVKEEVKCEEEKPEKGKENASSMGWSSDNSEPNSALDGQDDGSGDRSKAICKRLNANGKGKKRDGSRKQNRRKIPRNKAAKKRKEHRCHLCDYVTSHKEAKQLHEKSCKRRRYECYLCELKCFVRGSLKRHMQAKHTGERRFQCKVCRKRFVEKCKLNQHLAQHRDQFPFGCIKCGRGFSTEGDKTAHEKACGHRQYQCYVCKVFKLQNHYLRNHMRVHHT